MWHPRLASGHYFLYWLKQAVLPYPLTARLNLGNTGWGGFVWVGGEHVCHTAAVSAPINLRVFPEADLILSIEQIVKTKHAAPKH